MVQCLPLFIARKMNSEQVYISAVAFSAVFIMLTTLAGLMALLTRVFPGKITQKKKSVRKTKGPDQAIVAAIAAAVSTAVPGGCVTKIEESP